MHLTELFQPSLRRSTLVGSTLAFVAVFGLYVLGWIDNNTQGDPNSWAQSLLGWLPGWGEKRPTAFAPLAPFGIDPVFWGLSASFLLTVFVSRFTRPDPELNAKYFPKEG